MCGCPAQCFRMSTSFIVDFRSSSSSSSTASDVGSSSQASLSAISKIFTAYCRPVDFSIQRRTVLLTPLHPQITNVIMPMPCMQCIIDWTCNQKNINSICSSVAITQKNRQVIHIAIPSASKVKAVLWKYV